MTEIPSDIDGMAVYGTLRKGGYNSAPMQNFQFESSDKVKGLQMHSYYDCYPICIPAPFTASIVVEFYKIVQNLDAKTSLRRIHAMELGAGYDPYLLIHNKKRYIIYLASKSLSNQISNSKMPQVVSGDWITFIQKTKDTK
jgi:gamma-glutamylcyclotransferase (GGCT)/AIG2-like uncharacterized protein YtfP